MGFPHGGNQESAKFDLQQIARQINKIHECEQIGGLEAGE
jgi:hypothetical protein